MSRQRSRHAIEIAKHSRRQQGGLSLLGRQAILGILVGGSAMVIDPGGLQAFLMLRLLVLALALSAGAFLIRHSVLTPHQRRVSGAALALLVVMAISSVASRAPAVAVLGASGRQLGLLTWMLFGVAFLIGSSLFRADEGQIVFRTIAAWLGATTLWVGIVALAERYGEPLVVPSQSFPGRLQATFGNPAVLGAFAVLVLPILVAAAISGVTRTLTASSAAVAAWLLVATGTRGAWIGLGVGVTAAAAGVLRRRDERPWKGAAALIVAALVALAVVGALTGRWGSAREAIAGRLATWEIAIDVLADHPVIGVGPEGFAQAFAETVDEDFVIEYTRDQATDRVHAGVLDLAVSVGLIGLLFYLVVLAGLLMLIGAVVLSRGDTSLLQLGIACGLLAYFVQQQALFQLPDLDLAFWCLAGVLAVETGRVRASRHPRRFAGVAFGVGLVFVAYTAAGVLADHLDRRAVESHRPEAAMTVLERAQALRPADSVHPALASVVVENSGDPSLIARGISLYERALGWSAHDGRLLLGKTHLLVVLYQASGDRSALAEAEGLLEALVDREPTNGEGYLRLGAVRYYLGDAARARVAWEEAARLMPHRREPADNLELLDGG